MQFKITSESGFQDDKLYYEYLDILENYTYFHSDNLYKVKYHQTLEGGDEDDSEEIRYFNIVKKEE